MKTFTLFALFLVAGAAFSEGTFGYPEEDNVVVLTDANFDEAVAQFPFVLVEFYAPWCGHCKKLAPEYAQAAATLKELETPIPLAKVDATENSESAKAHGVQGYPTLKFFVDGQAIDYTGGRTAADIVNWIKKKTGPPSALLADQAALTAVQETEKVFLVYFAAGQEDTAAFETFQQVARQYDDIPFYHVEAEAVFAQFETAQRVAIYTQHAGEFTFLAADQAATAETVTALIEQNRFPIVMEFEGDEAIARIFQAEATAVFFFTDDKKHTFLDEFTAAATADAEKAVDAAQQLIFSTSTLTTGLGQRLAEFVGAKAADGPAVWIVKAGQNIEKYVHSGELSLEGVTQFIDQWRQGTLERHLKSADVPATNDEPVKVVVGRTFQELVVDNDQYVLLEFYAPWCGHCKKLAPIYDELAQKLSYMDNLVIAKIDATENEVASVQVQGFPTLKLFVPGKKDAPVDFNADRTLEGLTKGLREQMGDAFVEESTDL